MFSYFLGRKEANAGTLENSDTREADLQGALSDIHVKLQADLLELRSGAAGSSNDGLTQLLVRVTQQVDAITSSLELETELRVSLQARLQSLFEDIQTNEEEGRAALKSDVKLEMEGVLDLLKSDYAAPLKDLSTILTDVSKQVDTLEEAVKKDRDMRAVVEAKIDRVRTEQESKTWGLRKDMKLLVNDFATLRMEVAQLSMDMSTAMEVAQHEMSKETARGEAKVQEHLRLMVDEHQENSRKALSNVIAQIQNQARTASAEHDLLMAVGAKVDKVFSDQDQMKMDLRQYVQVAVSESHASLKSELTNVLPRYNDHNDKIKLSGKEAKHDERSPEGLQNLLAGTHVELQEALRTIKAGSAGDVNGLFQKVGKLERSVDFLQDQIKLALGNQLEKTLLEQDKLASGLKTDVHVNDTQTQRTSSLVRVDHTPRTISRAVEVATLPVSSGKPPSSGEYHKLSSSGETHGTWTPVPLHKERTQSPIGIARRGKSPTSRGKSPTSRAGKSPTPTPRLISPPQTDAVMQAPWSPRATARAANSPTRMEGIVISPLWSAHSPIPQERITLQAPLSGTNNSPRSSAGPTLRSREPLSIYRVSGAPL